MKFKTPYNAVPSKGEINSDPSMTVPDQSMSVQEIMRRYASGLPLGGQRVPIYHGEDEFLPDFDKLDLAEQQQYKEAAAAERKRIERDLKKQADKKRKDQQAAQAAQNSSNKDAGVAPPSGA